MAKINELILRLVIVTQWAAYAVINDGNQYEILS